MTGYTDSRHHLIRIKWRVELESHSKSEHESTKGEGGESESFVIFVLIIEFAHISRFFEIML